MATPLVFCSLDLQKGQLDAGGLSTSAAWRGLPQHADFPLIAPSVVIDGMEQILPRGE